MKFTVKRVADGHTMFQTEHQECVPSDATIRSMLGSGYKAYLDGKVYRPTKEGKASNGKRESKQKKP